MYLGDLRHTLICDRCQRVTRETYELAFGERAPVARIPHGWRWAAVNVLLCDLHPELPEPAEAPEEADTAPAG